MNLVYGEVMEILDEDGIKMGKVRVGRALRKVPLELLATVRCGDTVLLCEGVAIKRVDGDAETDPDHVPRDSR